MPATPCELQKSRSFVDRPSRSFLNLKVPKSLYLSFTEGGFDPCMRLQQRPQADMKGGGRGSGAGFMSLSVFLSHLLSLAHSAPRPIHWLLHDALPQPEHNPWVCLSVFCFFLNYKNEVMKQVSTKLYRCHHTAHCITSLLSARKGEEEQR